jgi:hypothetical protein
MILSLNLPPATLAGLFAGILTGLIILFFTLLRR